MQANFIRQIAQKNPSEFKIKVSDFTLYKRFFRYIWQYKLQLLLGSSTIFFLSFLQVIIPQITRYVIDVIIPNKRFDLIPWLGLSIASISLLMGGLNFARSYMMSLVGQKTIYDIRNDLYQHLQHLSLSFFENQRTGTLMARVMRDVDSLEKLVTTDVAEIVAEIFTFVVIVTYLIYADWQLTLLILVTLPLMIYLTQYFGKRMRGAYQEVQLQGAEMNNHLQESLSNIKLIKSCANEKYEIDRFSDRNLQNMQANLAAVQLSSGFAPVIDFMNNLGNITVLAYGSWEVMKGRMTVGDLTAFLAYLNQINQPTKRFSKVMHVIQKGATALERVFETLDTQPEVQEKPDAIALPEMQGHIQWEAVEFGYASSQPVIHNFTLDMQPGMTVALVGASGAGKTTLANLAARFYDPQQGRILIDGYDIRDVSLNSLRSQMGIVSQETLLLHGTVRENIAYGKPGVDVEEIISAAKIAHADEFIIELPQGYDTVIGERGVKLSGGQRQRIAIARALIKNPQFLILDEATSALDTESEYLIKEALQELLKNRTCLVIAHRLSTIQNADLIVVLEKGQIIETGTHNQLLAHSGRYAHLHAMQFPQKREETQGVLS
ncbi:ABC transporter ATP-binding protein [Nodularia chucula]|uniref:ABC transporter ATP-binding protein n=1 Tax=Nodularia chucula TaxID=3093667 RepID=UPI0039C6263B